MAPPSLLVDTDQVTLQAFQAFARAFHLHRQAMIRRLSRSGAQHGELFCLLLLARTDGTSQRDLADTLHLSPPRVTKILQGLEKTGAVRREVDPGDQRIIRVFLTDEGRRRAAENRVGFEQYVECIIGGLDEGDKLELTGLLDRVSDNIKGLLHLGPGECAAGAACGREGDAREANGRAADGPDQGGRVS